MSPRHVTLADLPARYREQVERQLRASGCLPGANGNSHTYNAPSSAVAGETSMVSSGEPAGVARRLSAGDRKRGPNKNEEMFNRLVLGGRGKFEVITLHLPGGSRYTPDFVTFDKTDEGLLVAVHLYEVKGTYRLNSQGRTLTAWREARAAFPEFTFHWFEQIKTDQGTKWMEKHKET